MDHLKHLTDIKDAKKSVRLLLSKLPFKPKLIIDIGAGRGEIAISLAFLGFKVVALEPSSTERLMIRKLIERYPRAKKNIKMIDGVAEKLPFSGDSVDLCILSQVLEHVKSPEKAVREIARILKPNGYLHLSSPNYLFPKEQHLGIFYWPLMHKNLLKLWANFLLKRQDIHSIDPSSTNFPEIDSFIDSINYTTDSMIKNISRKYKLSIIWSLADQEKSLWQQVRCHWEQNPCLAQALFILVSLPKKFLRSILVNLGILPMKLEYLIQKSEDSRNLT